jgi:hypothetical protein
MFFDVPINFLLSNDFINLVQVSGVGGFKWSMPHGDRQYCDEKVPAELVQRYRDAITTFAGQMDEKRTSYVSTFNSISLWNGDDNSIVAGETILFQNSTCDIQIGYYVNKTEDDFVFVMLNKETRLYLVVGTAGDHPFVYSDAFWYDNSDGSGPGPMTRVNGLKTSLRSVVEDFKIYLTNFAEQDRFH